MKPGNDAIAARIRDRLPDARVSIADDSHLHAGHTGAEGGAGHYTATVVSDAFVGLSRIARHRLVYDALADWIPSRIHALAVRAHTVAGAPIGTGTVDGVVAPPDPASGHPATGNGPPTRS